VAEVREDSIAAEWHGRPRPSGGGLGGLSGLSDSSDEGSSLQELHLAKKRLSAIQQCLPGEDPEGSIRRVCRSPTCSPPRQPLAAIARRISPSVMLFDNPLAEHDEAPPPPAPVAAAPPPPTLPPPEPLGSQFREARLKAMLQSRPAGAAPVRSAYVVGLKAALRS
jgi:hypothetical protein